MLDLYEELIHTLSYMIHVFPILSCLVTILLSSFFF